MKNKLFIIILATYFSIVLISGGEGGNKLKIVAMVHFSKRTIYLKFVVTHKQYDAINCKTI